MGLGFIYFLPCSADCDKTWVLPADILRSSFDSGSSMTYLFSGWCSPWTGLALPEPSLKLSVSRDSLLVLRVSASANSEQQVIVLLIERDFDSLVY